MIERFRPWLPELCLAFFSGYLIFRELGTFPAAWADDSLFMIVARQWAEGFGYSLPILRETWHFPFILGVGPTVIGPSALSIALFGFSVAAARVPQTIYLIAAVALMYLYTRRRFGRSEALWATALLVTLSAFVNTGKPLLGEVPAFVFLLAGVLLCERAAVSWRWAAGVGMLFGLAIVTKITLGLLFPALTIVWLWTLARREWDDAKDVAIVGVGMLVTVLVFSPTLGVGWNLLRDIQQYGFAGGGGEGGFLSVLRNQPELLTRFPYVYFGSLLALASIGTWQRSPTGPRYQTMIVWTVIILDILYFLNERGWYRHLLLAHLLLLPMVPSGAFAILTRRMGWALLFFFVIAQTWWQLTYMGSRRAPEAALAADVLREKHATTTMVIESPEVFVYLPRNDHWLFLTEEIRLRKFPVLEGLPLEQERHCLPVMKKVGGETLHAGIAHIQQIYGRYVLLLPPADCVPAL